MAGPVKKESFFAASLGSRGKKRKIKCSFGVKKKLFDLTCLLLINNTVFFCEAIFLHKQKNISFSRFDIFSIHGA